MRIQRIAKVLVLLKKMNILILLLLACGAALPSGQIWAQAVRHANEVDARLSNEGLDDKLRVFRSASFQKGQRVIVRAENRNLKYKMIGDIKFSLGSSYRQFLVDTTRRGAGDPAFASNKLHPEANFFAVSFKRVNEILNNDELIKVFGKNFLEKFVDEYDPRTGCLYKNIEDKNLISKTIVFIRDGIDFDKNKDGGGCFIKAIYNYYGVSNVFNFDNGYFLKEVGGGGYVPNIKYSFLIYYLFIDGIEPGQEIDDALASIRSSLGGGGKHGR